MSNNIIHQAASVHQVTSIYSHLRAFIVVTQLPHKNGLSEFAIDDTHSIVALLYATPINSSVAVFHTHSCIAISIIYVHSTGKYIFHQACFQLYFHNDTIVQLSSVNVGFNQVDDVQLILILSKYLLNVCALAFIGLCEYPVCCIVWSTIFLLRIKTHHLFNLLS